MTTVLYQCPGRDARPTAAWLLSLALALGLVAAAGCSHATSSTTAAGNQPIYTVGGNPMSTTPPSPDPRIGLKPGLWDAAEATWNLRVVSETRPSEKFVGSTNSDMAFLGNYVIQGNYNGYQVWDVSTPSKPTLVTAYYCPASQSDVSAYKNLLFVSGEGFGGRLDCTNTRITDSVSRERLRGLRIFDISDIRNPKYVGNVQTCRGSHTHTLLVDPKDRENVYVYISGSAPIRPAGELTGCVGGNPEQNPNSALFRIEVIKVPLAHPEQAAIVSSPRIFSNLAAPPRHGETQQDIDASRKAAAEARAKGGFTATIFGMERVLPPQMAKMFLDSLVKVRGGTGEPTAADSAKLRADLQGMVDRMFAANGPRTGPTQCHDITVYPAIGFAGGACEGYGMLLDISDPAHPNRIAAVSDSNFSYWHSATFNNDGTKLLFSDEWGGGGAPKCRATDPREWGADAIFTIDASRQLQFQSYYKLPAPQTQSENCVAHNGSMIPIPGRDVMVQAWYQGGISVFDFTDAKHPKEIAFFDRGPVDTTARGAGGGSWSAYWYNGVIVSSEIARGLDVFELTPSGLLSQNELDAAKSVRFDYYNTQGQQKFVWPASFALARAYLDQLERANGLAGARISAARQALASAERASGSQRTSALTQLASQLDGDAGSAGDGAKVRMLSAAVRDLANGTR